MTTNQGCRIWKFPLEITDEQTVELPAGARLLTVQMQKQYGDRRETPCLWAIVDPEAPRVRLRFRIVGTGNPFPDAEDCSYLSTFQLEDGALVFHVFVNEREGV